MPCNVCESDTVDWEVGYDPYTTETEKVPVCGECGSYITLTQEQKNSILEEEADYAIENSRDM